MLQIFKISLFLNFKGYKFFSFSDTSVTDAMIVLSTPTATNELHSITVTCTIHSNSTADQCVVMAMADGRMTRTGDEIHVYLHA